MQLFDSSMRLTNNVRGSITKKRENMGKTEMVYSCNACSLN